MKAAADILPEDVQKLFGEIEDYLENLQSENLSARARIQRDEILFDIEQLKERYQWGFLPGDENNIQAIEDQGIILKQGYLEKRAKDSKIFGSEWQKRWCVLDDTAFYYYANEKSKQPKGIFAIESYHAQLAPYLRKDSRRDCCFELTCPDKRTYEFTAANPAEAIDWVDHITFLLKDMNSFVIPCEEEEEEEEKNKEEEEENEKDYHNTDKEEAYDDIESFDTSSVTFNQDSTLVLDKEETMVQGKEGIYEVLPDEDFNMFAQDDRENAGNIKNKGFIRHYANYYQGLWNCTGGHPDELSFQRGDLIYIISKEYNMYGWWVGKLNDVIGIVPRNYLMAAYDLEE